MKQKRFWIIVTCVLMIIAMIPIISKTVKAEEGDERPECSGGQHTPGVFHEADYTECGGGWIVGYYECSECGRLCHADGSMLDWNTEYAQGEGKHTPGNHESGGYTECGGGWIVDWYHCSRCGKACTGDGTPLGDGLDPGSEYYMEGTGIHTPGSELHEPFYSECSGGIKVSYYECVACGLPCNEQGEWLPFEEGTGRHTPGDTIYPANYTECGGGFVVDYHYCSVCGEPCHEDGSRMDWFTEYREGAGQHTPGRMEPANYTECGGGFLVDTYRCSVCGFECNEDGSPITNWEEIYKEGTGAHTLGQHFEANYTECGGGFQTDYYECTECWSACDSQGQPIQWIEGTGHHTAGKLVEADYTECGGGFTVDHYECDICQEACHADGSMMNWRTEYKEGTGEHPDTEWVVVKEPTSTEDGIRVERCRICGEVLNEDLIPRLSDDGLRLENGKWYYYKNGKKQTGWQRIGGEWYWFSSTGAAMTGWGKSGNNWYYMDETGKMQTGWITVGNKRYNLGSDGIMKTGWLRDGETWYYLDSSGAAVTGWKQIGSTWYFFDKTTGAMKTGWFEDSGKRYCMASSGAMLTGWQKNGNEWYYLDASGEAVKGWKQVGTTWYFFDRETCAMKTGWFEDGGKQYYLKSSGAMATGWTQIGNDWYYMSGSGTVFTGWTKVGTSWYYMDTDGKMLTGWQTIGGKEYYLKSNGTMATGWTQIGSNWYYFDGSGMKTTGWNQISGGWYYMDTEGKMLTGWQMIGGKQYYFYSSGKMASSTWIGNYYLTSSGAMATNAWVDGNRYYVDNNGTYVPGRAVYWVLNGDVYHTTSNCPTLARSRTIYSGSLADAMSYGKGRVCHVCG